MNAQQAKQLVKQFDLVTAHCQMSIGVLKSGHVVALYLGERLPEKTSLGAVITDIGRASYLADTDRIPDFRLEQLPLVYPAFGTTDMRTPAIDIVGVDGSRVLDLRFCKAHWLVTKKRPDGLPATRPSEGQKTLALTMADPTTGIAVTLYIDADQQHDTFTQHVEIQNTGSQNLHLKRAMSWSWDILDDQEQLLTLNGAWGREAQPHIRPLQPGIQGVDSKRGASGHGQNPFIGLIDATNNRVLSADLVYSGDFVASAEVDMHQNTRVQLGISPWQFDWVLTPGAIFTTPEAVVVWQKAGIQAISPTYHRYYQDCLLPKEWAHKIRPVVINSWEAAYFDYDRETLLKLAKQAAEVGIERFVVDDGWFGRRQDITSSLGDWTPNEAKLGGSLASLIEAIKTLGLDFGLWVEPEMVSPDSELFSEHPDWIIADPHHRPQTPRCQYVLDLGRREVQDYLITTLTKLLADNDIAYLKWDMNRNLTDTYSVELSADHQGECRHRYILGLYRVLTVLRQTFPQVMIEGCAGGGGRFDAGMLAFAPQIWASDDTDAIARLAVQHGTSMVYPPACISCHVSAVPNHQLKRVTPLETRTIVAEFGTLGYELDLSKCSQQEREQLATSISTYKKYRQTLQFGRLDWLSVHDQHNEYAWQKLTDTTLIIDHVNVLVQPNTVMKRLCAQNLPPEAQYTLQGDDKHYSAAYLMAVGIVIPQPARDFDSHRWIFKRIGGDAV